MTIEVCVFRQHARVFGEACRQHIGKQARHDCGTKHVIEPLQPFTRKVRVDVVKEIIDVLHCHLKILPAQFIGRLGFLVEF